MAPRVVLAFITVIFILLSTNSIFAVCEENQVDINTATAEKLNEIVHIGPSRSEQIITLRPFGSVSDMIRISGIGEIYLSAIKEQGLACVKEEETGEEVEEKVKEKNEVAEEGRVVEIETVETPSKEIKLETISLNPKVIKSEDDIQNLNKNNYAIYGFVAFSVLLGVLFILRKNKYNKNEFI